MVTTDLDQALIDDMTRVVAQALAEDLGNGDLTAALISDGARSHARVVTREAAVLCGAPWFDEVFRQLDADIDVRWHRSDGDSIEAGTIVCELNGPSRPILSGERTALNLLQMLSGTATATRAYTSAIAGTRAQILDTRKTVPGLRLAQKYAVRCGGGTNHRVGLYDAVLIKENHIAAAGGISAAVEAAAARAESVMIEIEVESLEQLDDALTTAADRLLLDNFSIDDLAKAVERRNASLNASIELEASGNITLANVREIAETGVDYISVGAITKNVTATDYSMRFE
ncbi:MAG: carboxylating nicotinate-nucleotide diphosphorylase [Gammaproteobacteria bacterium]|nr:carboxylating nicotinate-nucleotide diphosphorylase [Gammaproteobacteria bacterium]